MGPWCHGCWSRGDGNTLGDLNFASNTGEFFREHIELPFFIQNLKGKGEGLKTAPDNEIPKAWVFETGTNQWLRFADLASQECHAEVALSHRKRRPFVHRASPLRHSTSTSAILPNLCRSHPASARAFRAIT
jgi:hypothetical protein